MRKKRGFTAKEMCERVGMAAPDWSRKSRRDRSTFSIEEIGAIADMRANALKTATPDHRE